jgi:transposase
VCATGHSLTRCCARACLCLFTPVHAACLQFQCAVCGLWKAGHHKHGSKCSDCHNLQHREAPCAAAATPASPAPSSPQSLFGRPAGCADQLSTVERAAIVTLHGIGWTGRDIAAELRCDEHAVTRWVRRWQETRSLDDGERSGRPRCTTDDTDAAIEAFADEKKRTVPKESRKELQLGCSARTIRRRLDEARRNALGAPLAGDALAGRW